MANVSPTITQIETIYGHAHRFQWTLANGDTGIGPASGDAFVQMPGSSDRSVQVIGTFGAGGTVVIEGTNMSVDPLVTPAATWSTLNDTFGNALSITSAGERQINEATGAIRPRVTAGDGTTALTVAIIARRTL